ncbi:hypothetical protein FN846DRAFT_1018291 [Sphaerosporella brunnea]|uniref:Uncharacterized protein n=1 Tax=Sphaerosporella brunnea TaxID=1250544 RepID=A0A5J5FC38_9PEZI|nr:hypothetical protein FN846DRAFT_1018291 [Sphaerosporella brunnea]
MQLLSALTALPLFLALAAAQTAQPFSGDSCNGNAFSQYTIGDCSGNCINIGNRAGSINLVRKSGDSHGVTCSVYPASGCQGEYQSVGIQSGVNSGCTYVPGGFQSGGGGEQVAVDKEELEKEEGLEKEKESG